MGFKAMEDLPADKQFKIGGIPMNGMWWLGFVLLAIVPLPMDFISLGLSK